MNQKPRQAIKQPDRSARNAIRRAYRGFTLIELMIAIAVMGVLAAVTMPSYVEYVQRGRLADAFRNLADMQIKLSEYYLDQRSYAGACSTGTGSSVAPLPNNTPDFVFSCPNLGATAYEVDVAGQGRMAGFAYKLTLSNGSATKSTSSLPSGWATTNADSCWIFRRDGSC